MALADFFTRPSSEAPAEGGLSPDLADRLEQAKAAYLKQFGKPMPITSGFRTKEQQQRLFDQRKFNPNLVAAPGTSLHGNRQCGGHWHNRPRSVFKSVWHTPSIGCKRPRSRCFNALSSTI